MNNENKNSLYYIAKEKLKSYFWYKGIKSWSTFEGIPVLYAKQSFSYDDYHFKIKPYKSNNGDHPKILDYLSRSHWPEKAVEIYHNYRQAIKNMVDDKEHSHVVIISHKSDANT